MAPGCVLACRRSTFRMSVFYLFILFLCFINYLDCSQLVYDRLSLLSLRSTALNMCSSDLNLKFFAEQPCMFQPPFKVCQVTGCACWKRRRRRRRGIRAGVLVKLKKLRILNSGARPTVESRPSYLLHVLPATSTSLRWTTRRETRRGGVVHSNLRSLRRAGAVKLSAVSSSNRPVESTTVLMALINARSVVNKTLILNDYYVKYGLDFLFITETWLNDADMSPLVELLPSGCSYLSTSRSNRRGGGLAVIFNNMMKCKLLPAESSKSFEVQLMKIDLP